MGAAVGAWVLSGGAWARRGRPNRPASAAPSAARFPGDPGAGKVLTGATVFTGSAGVADGLSWLNSNAGVNHLLSRRYYSDLWSRTAITSDHTAGRIPFHSFKLSATTSNAAAILGGSRDAELTAEAQWAAAQGFPIITCFYHEPEDNWPSDTDAANYRAIFRRIAGIFATNGATNVLWTTVFMASWSFLTNGGEAARGPWYKWDPDWKGTKSGASRPNSSDWYTGTNAVCTLSGFDQYSPTVGDTSFHEFSADMDATLTRMAADGRPVLPWTVPEFGTSNATGLPSDGWTGYYQRAFRYMRDNAGVGFVSYNTDTWNFSNGTDAAARFAGYKAALSSEAAYLTAVRPS